MLTLFGGKGGVGKTTCAAAWGLARAAAGRRVLALSTDPAHSLGDAFGITLRKNRVTPCRPRLSLLELDAARSVKQWIARRRPALSTLLERGTLLDREDVQQALVLPIPGLDELAAFIAITDLVTRANYDDVLVDTAPTGHALRLLETASAVAGFTELLGAMHERHAMVAQALGGEVGANELVEELRRDAASVDARLHDPTYTRLVWVAVPEPVAIAETVRTIDWLLDRRFPLARVIINRVVSESPSRDPLACVECAARLAFERAATRPLETLVRKIRPKIAIQLVPDYPREPRRPPALARLGRDLAEPRPGPARLSKRGFSRARLRPSPAREPAPALALADSRLVFFGGKGGVGKTTCAASAALAIARAYPDRRVRLLSTDPAPSLGDVLSMRIGDSWTALSARGRLEVRELDAAAAFLTYRQRYRAAVDALFDDLRGGSAFDAVADRAVFERLFELAPPGIDELVALVTVVDLVGEDPGAILIVDTAPTGHALRLLSSQADLRGWLDLVMRILVKYQLSARAGSFGRQLVELSRGLRRLQGLLSDPTRTTFVAVVRPGTLPRMETLRLVADLRHLRVSVPMLIVNAETTGTCRGCRSRARVEAAGVTALARACRGRSQRCDIIHAPLQLPPPRGARELTQWSTVWRTSSHRHG